MSVITLPAGLQMPAGCTIGQQRYDLAEASDSTGASAARLLGPPRWSMSLRSVDALTLADAGLWESLVLQMQGRVNHLAMYDPVRQAPQGTLRGAPTLNASVAAGATSLVLGNVARTNNMLVQSRVFNGAAWVTSNASVTANTAADPVGTVSADTVSDIGAGALGFVRQVVGVADDDATYCASIFVLKTSGGTSKTVALKITLDNGGTPLTKLLRVNTDLGTVLSGTGAVEDYSASWWRVSLTATNNSTGNTEALIDFYPAIDNYDGSGSTASVTGSATVAFAQLELGSAPSTYRNATIAAGDWLQIGSGVGSSQLVKVVAGSTESTNNTLSVTFEPPLRMAFAGGSDVTWDKPLAYFKQTSAPQWSYRLGRAHKVGAYALDLLEDWTP